MPEDATTTVMVQSPIGILAILIAILAAIFWFGERAPGRKLFSIVPALVFCYFVPTLFSTFGIIPQESPLYDWVKTFLLPCSLLLLILALDVPGILRLGPKAIIMLLAGTAGVVIGGPLALAICILILPDSMALPDDIWRGMAAIAGSWIGGGANMVALGDIAEISKEMFGHMVVVDVFVANIWMGVLLYLSGHQKRIDRWTGADRTAMDALTKSMADFHERTKRIPSMTDYLLMLAIGFVVTWIGIAFGDVLAEQISHEVDGETKPILSATTWKFILVTTLGVGLSFTRARNLEGAGASRVGSVMIYLLVASIGAHASFAGFDEKMIGMIVMGIIWMLFHVTIMLVVGRLIRAPIFYVAVGSQANIGGAASAPVVAAAYHPALAPVGALLAVAGYVLGTYAGLLCLKMLQLVSNNM